LLAYDAAGRLRVVFDHYHDGALLDSSLLLTRGRVRHIHYERALLREQLRGLRLNDSLALLSLFLLFEAIDRLLHLVETCKELALLDATVGLLGFLD